MTAECLRCGRPTPDGYVCHDDALLLAQSLRAASGHAEDVEAVLARQTRYGAGGRGGSDEPLPVDLAAAAKLEPVAATVARWVAAVTDLSGRQPRWRPMAGPVCPVGVRCEHVTCAAIRRRYNAGPPLTLHAAWLAQHVHILRKHPHAERAFNELDTACTDLARLVDRPADKDLVGMCDCGKVLYAATGKTAVQCPVPTCKLIWDVARSRAILRHALGEKLVTAAEAGRLGAYWDDRSSDQIRKLVNKWHERAQLAAHGQLGGEPTFRFGDVADRLARTPRRTAAGKTAEEASEAA